MFSNALLYVVSQKRALCFIYVTWVRQLRFPSTSRFLIQFRQDGRRKICSVIFQEEYTYSKARYVHISGTINWNFAESFIIYCDSKRRLSQTVWMVGSQTQKAFFHLFRCRLFEHLLYSLVLALKHSHFFSLKKLWWRFDSIEVFWSNETDYYGLQCS